LGDGSTADRLTAVNVSGLTSGVAAMALGDFHTCALTTTGGAKCWGKNVDGELGDGLTDSRAVPGDVATLSSGVAALAAGSYHTCALTTAGGVKCWGYNFDGQLGDGSFTSRLTPVNVPGLTGAPNVVSTAIKGGERFTCALTSTGAVKCWGNNGSGQLGNGRTSAGESFASTVLGLSPGTQNIAAGAYHTCSLTAAGGVKCWGDNSSGQLGDNSTSSRSTPVGVTGLTSGVAALAGGLFHTCALTTAGGVKCWGNNGLGQLGDSTITNRAIAADVAGLVSGVVAVTAGNYHTCALTTLGGVKCWGYNGTGQLGDGTTTIRLTAVDVTGLTGLTTRVAVLAAGSSHTCALTTSGGVKCWGYNFWGQLGDSSVMDRLTAVDVTGLTTGVAALVTGNLHTCVLTATGGVKCWGRNVEGQLGDGSTTNRLTAVDVSGLTSGVAALAAGSSHNCALTTSGGVKCWGYNADGEVGDGTVANRTLAADVAGLTSGVAALAAGGFHTCALTTAGGVKCWGLNSSSQLGDGTTTNRLTPVDVANRKSTNDLNGDGKSDIVYRDTSGAAGVALMNGVTTTASANILSAGSGWSVTHIADFDGDGKADLLIRNADGRIATLLMNGTAVLSFNPLVAAGTGYTALVTGDFNGDGKADIILKNIDGSAAVLLMNGGTVLKAAFVLTAGSPWNVTHAADLDGDGKTDLIIRNNDGSAAILIMNGTGVISAGLLLGAASPWSVSHVADLSGDGKADLIIKNTDGSAAMLLMNGTTVTGAAFLLTPGSPYTVTHIGDFNGDGKADILIKHTDGSVVMLQMNGTVVATATFLLTAGSPYAVAQIADYNGDGKSDILLRNADGSATVILMNGGVVTAAGNVWGPGTLAAVP
jgi:alpha-tubulin suppressor-like RCC1 family protein